jgi:hypothetical protein
MALDPVTAILNIGNTVIDRLIPDKTAAAQAKAQLIQAEINGDLAAAHDQLNVDAIEAASQSTFVAGWRPFVGWGCGAAVVYSYVVQPFLVSIMVFSKVNFDPTKLPHLDMITLIGLLTTMLGFGAMRSIDKAQGTENGH